MKEELKVPQPEVSAPARILFGRLEKPQKEEPEPQDQTQELLDRFNGHGSTITAMPLLFRINAP